MLLVLSLLGVLSASPEPARQPDTSASALPLAGAASVTDDEVAPRFPFPERLFEQGLYEHAELEYRRAHQLASSPRSRWEAQAGVLSCLLARKRYADADTYGAGLEAACPDDRARLRLSVQRARARALLGDPAMSVVHLRQGLGFASKLGEDAPSELVLAARRELVLSLVELERYEAAARETESMVEDGLMDPQLVSALRLAPGAIPKRSPWLTGSLSAVVPGLGQIVAGHHTDGVVAFVLVGAFVAASTMAFVDEEYTVGGVVAFFGLGWYSGNIFGAVNAAHRYNRDARRSFRGRILDGLVPKSEGGRR